MGMMRKVRIVAMRGYEARMRQITDKMVAEGWDETSTDMEHVKLVEDYRKMQKEYLKLAAINKKEYEDAERGKVED